MTESKHEATYHGGGEQWAPPEVVTHPGLTDEQVAAMNKPPKKRRSWLVPLITGIVGVGLGVAVSGGGGVAPTAAPVPAVTQTVQGPTVTKTVEVPDPAVVDAAREAMVASEKVVALGAEALQSASRGFTAIANGDLSGLNSEVTTMTSLGEKMKPAVNEYNDAKARFEELAK